MRSTHVAGVWKSNRLLSVGINKSRIHGKWIDSYAFPCSTHAEVAALKKLDKSKTAGSTIVSIQLKDNGTVGMAYPCKNCQNAIEEYGVKNVIYTINNDPNFVDNHNDKHELVAA